MIDKVALSKSLLEILACFRLETASIVIELLAIASARALLCSCTRAQIIVVMVSAHDKIVSVELTSLR